MKVTYKIDFNDEYLSVAQRLVLSQNTMSRLTYVSRWFAWPPLIAMAGFLIYFFVSDGLDWSLGLMLGGLIAFSVTIQFLIPRNLAKARARNPLNGTTPAISMGESGVDLVTPVSNAHLECPAFSRAIVRPEGVLLKLKTRSYVWLPDNSLTHGSPQDVRQLLAENVKE
jgi:hypothetical protein